jgi:SAM-dependent methyltransferase
MSGLLRIEFEEMSIIICPLCGRDLALSGPVFHCPGCGHEYRSEDGIPLLFLPNDWSPEKRDVTETMRGFYEETPFPQYDDSESIWKLQEKAKKSVFARLLDEQIPSSSLVLEAGCGTGQLSNFLAIRPDRTVYATDISLNSLRLGQEFKQRHGLGNVSFLQMNLFRPVFRPDTFDFVICNGVLHHTSDPFLGFATLCRLTKPGGFIIIGLYNKYGRLTTDIRRWIFRLSRNRFQFLDQRMKRTDLNDLRKRSWFQDQYKNPHESKHMIGEVLGWFERCRVDFMNSVPKAVAFETFSEQERLFEKSPPGSRIDHLIVQLAQVFSGRREGGFFVMIGRREKP